MTFSDFYNLESLVLPDSQVHPFYTPSSRPIFGDGGDVRVFGDVMAMLWRCSAMLWRCSWRCYGGVMAVFGNVMAVLWRCSDVMAVFGEIMAVFGDVRRDYGGTWMTP